MCEYSKYNDPKLYNNLFYEMQDFTAPSESIFALRDGEKIIHNYQEFNSVTLDELFKILDTTDIAIVEEIARSKYLTSLQIYEFIKLRGIEVKRHRLRKRLLKLIKMRVIQENEIVLPEAIKGIKYYEIDYNGYQLSKTQGISFNKGNRYLSYSKKVEIGFDFDPKEVKRVLVGNQIVLGMLLNNVKMERFGIMETIRPEIEEQQINECLIRTVAIIRIDSESILAYEVVRDSYNSYIKLADKVRRYFKILKNKDYLKANHHGDREYPQLVICGESLGHNQKIVSFLKKEELWNEEDTILFTEDLLNIKGSRKSIYEIKDNNEIIWYELPVNRTEGNSQEKRPA